jgi:glycosyl transferase family 2
VVLDGRGSGSARNAAARVASHEVLIFLDDDQVASPMLVEAHLLAHERHGAVIVQGDYPLAPGYDRDGASLIFERSRRSIGIDRAPGVRFCLWSGNFSVRRATWLQAGRFDESLPRSQDLDFGLRVADLGVPMVIEKRARSNHLHRVSPAGFRRQCFTEGRCMVRISRRRGVPLESLRGGRVDRTADRVIKRFWLRYPRSADLVGRWLGGMLWLADRLRLRPAQLLSARLLRRFHALGGIALETAAPPQPAIAVGTPVVQVQR